MSYVRAAYWDIALTTYMLQTIIYNSAHHPLPALHLDVFATTTCHAIQLFTPPPVSIIP